MRTAASLTPVWVLLLFAALLKVWIIVWLVRDLRRWDRAPTLWIVAALFADLPTVVAWLIVRGRLREGDATPSR